MINGAHIVLYSANADADRNFIRDVVGYSGIDAGGGWLIFDLPRSELAVHPDEEGGSPEFFLMCDDIDREIDRLAALGVSCAPTANAAWGRLTYLNLPSGAPMGLYQPRHARPN